MSSPDKGKSNGAMKGASGEQASSRRALVLHPVMRADEGRRDPEARLDEAVGLAAAIDLDVAERLLVTVNQPRPATLLGSGKVEDLKGLIAELEIGLVIVDHALTPVQQRNLERAWIAKVIDRTGLILEIFGARASTHEGRLQVELAALEYQRGRLVRSWTHLERQRGGFGFLGGPGESQIEIDRRLIGERIIRIKRDLESVRRTRSINRASRSKAHMPTVALVGYTNAGKSTLFNRLSGAGVMAKDLLFATLDPTMRSIRLPNGKSCVLSDTVGFISDLPTHLVAAFRATLEEVTEADLIVHVRDIAHPDSERQKEDVESVLHGLGALEGGAPIIEALNKIDELPPERRRVLQTRSSVGAERARQYPISALTGEGVEELLGAIGDLLNKTGAAREISVPLSDGATIAWLYRHGDVRGRHDDGELAHLTVALDSAAAARFERRQSAENRAR